jgi:hypothetical protein
MSPLVSARARGGPDHTRPSPPQCTRRAFLGVTGTAALAGLTAAATGCGDGTRRSATDSGASASPETAVLAERYVTLTLELAKHQPSLVDAWLGSDERRRGPRTPAPGLRRDAATLLADVGRLDLASTRGDYLRGQIRALDIVAGRLVGEGQTFAAEARAGFGHAPPPRDRAAFDVVRRELAERLRGAGTLAERHAAFRRALAVPPDRIEAVFQAAIAWCREASRPWLALPEGETLTTRGSDDTGWAAFCRPTGSLTSEVWIARNGGADVAQVLQLAAHEGTPGHHAQHVLGARQLVDARRWVERALYPAFGPHRLLAEGAAEAGADLLLPIALRERICAEVLLPIAGQRPSLASNLVRIERLVAALDLEVAYAAEDYLDGTLGSADAAARLRDDALLLDPAGMVSFVEKQRSRVLAYPLGRRLVTEALGAGDARDKWARFGRISTALSLSAADGE